MYIIVGTDSRSIDEGNDATVCQCIFGHNFVVLQDKLVKGICRLCMLLQQSGHLSELRNLGAQMLSFCANNAHVREATTVYAIIKDFNQG